MPPNNKKKKKPAANPARGFATVSVPSKPKSTNSTAPASTAESKSVSESERPTPAESSRPAAETQDAPSLQDYSPEELERHLEDAELQILVEKYASKCKNDAVRQVSKLETERRILRQQAFSLSLLEWFPAEVLDSILKFAETEEHELSPSSVRDSNTVKKPGSEEDLYMKLWALRETLLKLGFPEEKVEDSLKHLLHYFSGNFATANRDMVCNLDEALDWLAMHCNPKELPSYTQTTAQLRKDEKDLSWITDREPAQSSTLSLTQNDSKAKQTKSPSNEPLPPVSSPYDSDSSLDPDTLLPKYMELQTQLYNLQPEIFDKPKKGKKPARENIALDTNEPRVAKIRRKIANIENDVLFDRTEAEYRWKEKLDDLRKEAAFFRQNPPTKKTSLDEPGAKDQPEEKVAEPSSDVQPVDDEEIADLLGDMFQAEEPALETGVILEELSKAAITIRDFGKWTGLSPRRVLEDTCKARDTSCAIIYKDFSSASHSNRKAVEVRWSKPQDVPFLFEWDKVTHKSSAYATFVSMDTIATPTAQQAEAFVSTLALFILFPQNSKEGKAYMRLPAVWRELWAELASAKKLQEDEIDKKTIKHLKKLIRENQGNFEDDVVLSDNFRRRNGTSSKPESPARPSNAREATGPESQLQRLWMEKSSTPSFNNMVQGRMNLPIWAFKNDILNTLDTHRALIVCSETGSGKSTQIPSFILEHEMTQGRPCKIYVTEPRRISAISLARRVSEELGESKNDVGTARSLIGFAVRLESKVSQSTRLVFATTGVVVRMLERPDDFQDITHIVLDEVHERSIDSDFLLIVLRRLMQRRPDLKLILMSATLEAQKFSNYLGGVPVLNIPGRTFPVEMKFLEDAVEMTNYRLSENDSNANLDDDTDEMAPENVEGDTAGGMLASLESYSKQTRDTVLNFDEYRLDYQLIKKLLIKIATAPEMANYSKAILIFMPGMAEIRRLNDEILSEPIFQQGWIVHALHSSIASEDQEKAFIVPPEGMRKIVIATNIAETGITIPDITAVIDTGKEKTMRFDEKRQLSRLVEAFISRANAKQRRGRAGRVQNGICFHMFTKHRHEKLLAEQQTPEMLRLSLQDLVLRVKICKLGEVEPTLLEALDAPSSKNIRRAIDSLKEVKALTNSENLTPLGMQLAKLPLDVFLGKLIIHGAFFKCLDASISIAAILSSKSPFVNTMGSNTQKDLARLSFKKGDSDLLTVYNAYCAWKRTRNTPGANEYAFCRKNFLSSQTLLNIEDIKMQLIVSIADAGLLLLDPTQKTALNRARYGGRQRQFFTIPEEYDINSSNDVIVNAVIAWSFYPKLLTREGKGWRNVANNQAVTLHPTSVNKQTDASIKWLSYYHIMQGRNRNYNAFETNAVDDFAIALLCGEAEFKMYAGVVSIDANRIRFAVRDWKSMLALKILSARIRDILSGTFRDPQKKLSYKQQQWVHIWQQIFTQVGK
ncbi:P-loop containing nucleoside triphosphate hydrolase protein [Aspergillus flavus]|uniref:RNA helicase n=3 Tax=Aspergillus subgen. Circumdati TaxID=2720871 RepID=A0A1S9DDU5_ASPOZ|nr:ATP-dependent RNA helicase A [Aspergillus oryzae 3.042]KAB8240726.1 P-loop containing nucleoside triphosphate hydrolase protein [Aspergillus flavus]OOO07267.1 helicase domain-containing protein [Aspergillus oryzae]|eukprot:EIT77434.1 ATP-dependent RNA helicase A [Aspergillus oryzae 3.042]